MSKKIIVVGGVAGGASVAARVRRLDETADIKIFEKGPDVSFSNCSLPYHLSNVIPNADDIVLMSPIQFKKQYNIDAIVNHEVVDVDVAEQMVSVKDVISGEIQKYSYDELFLSPGAVPICPRSIEGISKNNVFTIRDVTDIKSIREFLEKHQVKNVSVIGGGFIGIETAENLVQGGYSVSLIEGAEHVLGTIDLDMAQIIQKTLLDHHVNLVTNDTLTEIRDDTIILDSGKELKAEAVILAIGVRPNTELAEKIGVTIGETGGIKVNQNYETNLPHIHAVGDAIEVYHQLLRKPTRLSLAFPAQIEARQAVDHMYGRPIKNRGVIGSQCIPVFEMNVASTGLTEKDCRQNGISYRTAMVIPKDHVPLLPNARPLYMKLIFAYPSGEILGAQAIGESAVDKQIDIIATEISHGGYIEDLETLELCYQPTFSTAKNAINMVGLVATNVLNNEFKQISVSQVRTLIEQNALIIDVRERDEYKEGHVKTAKNIPMSEFRQHLNEIPKYQPVYIHCLSGQRSYNVVRALTNLGYEQVYNIAGSFLNICEFEYYEDVIQQREPIVTNYRFDLL
ncbi:pyridine nucleotide-disulfide oxidoreductase [Pediococcus acidilactici]|nr:pyridine nucleotide-disulfide oxidoreductase [Pediococcus acidilactici]UWF33881.1 FAD-dependent oxidoreductase [Pediococcus acidilactici]